VRAARCEYATLIFSESEQKNMDRRWSTLDSIATALLSIAGSTLLALWLLSHAEGPEAVPAWLWGLALGMAGVGALLFVVSLLANRGKPKLRVSEGPHKRGSRLLHLYTEDGRDLGYPVPFVFGPRRGLREGPYRGRPMQPKPAKDGMVNYVYPDHFGTGGPRPEQPGTYTVKWSLVRSVNPTVLDSMKLRTAKKSRFEITEADNKEAQAEVVPTDYKYRLDVVKGDAHLELRVVRDGDGAPRAEDHTIAVTDPEGVEHVVKCHAGQFVYPDEFRVGNPGDASPMSPPLVPGSHYVEARSCTFSIAEDPDGDTFTTTVHLRAFARALVEVP
jgi:hypothetical protein